MNLFAKGFTALLCLALLQVGYAGQLPTPDRGDVRFVTGSYSLLEDDADSHSNHLLLDGTDATGWNTGVGGGTPGSGTVTSVSTSEPFGDVLEITRVFDTTLVRMDYGYLPRTEKYVSYWYKTQNGGPSNFVFVNKNTSGVERYMCFNTSDGVDAVSPFDNRLVHIFLGAGNSDNEWHHFRHDLDSYLTEWFPGETFTGWYGINVWPTYVGNNKVWIDEVNFHNGTDGNLVLQVERLDGDDGAVSVDVSSTQVTALADVDYPSFTNELYWHDGVDGIIEYSVPLIMDQVVEPDEEFTATITNAQGGVTIITHYVSTNTILTPDDPQIEFLSLTPSASEDAGSILFDVIRKGRREDTTVSYQTNDIVGGATGGVDYGPVTQGTIEWMIADNDQKTVAVTLIDNNSVDGDREFELELLSAPQSYTIIGATEAAGNILDNEPCTPPVNIDPANPCKCVLEISDVEFQIVARPNGIDYMGPHPNWMINEIPPYRMVGNGRGIGVEIKAYLAGTEIDISSYLKDIEVTWTPESLHPDHTVSNLPSCVSGLVSPSNYISNGLTADLYAISPNQSHQLEASISWGPNECRRGPVDVSGYIGLYSIYFVETGSIINDTEVFGCPDPLDPNGKRCRVSQIYVHSGADGLTSDDFNIDPDFNEGYEHYQVLENGREFITYQEQINIQPTYVSTEFGQVKVLSYGLLQGPTRYVDHIVDLKQANVTEISSDSTSIAQAYEDYRIANPFPHNTDCFAAYDASNLVTVQRKSEIHVVDIDQWIAPLIIPTEGGYDLPLGVTLSGNPIVSELAANNATIVVSDIGFPGYQRIFKASPVQLYEGLLDVSSSGAFAEDWDGYLYGNFGQNDQDRRLASNEINLSIEIVVENSFATGKQDKVLSWDKDIVLSGLLEKPGQISPVAAPYYMPIEDSAESENSDVLFVDPVFLFSGEFYQPEVDLMLPGIGFNFVWQRFYRSRNGTDTIMGNNWDYSYNVRLEPTIINGVTYYVSLRTGSHISRQYARVEEGLFRLPGTEIELRKVNNVWQTDFPDGGKWYFDESGRLLRTEDRNGNQMNFQHFNGAIHVTDTMNRLVVIQEFPQGDPKEGFVESLKVYNPPVVAPGNMVRQVAYDYYLDGVQDIDGDGIDDGSLGDLKSVTRFAKLEKDGIVESLTTYYTYDAANLRKQAQNNLLSIIDPNGNTILKNTYSATLVEEHPEYDAVIEQLWGTTDQTSLGKAEVSPNPASNDLIIITYDKLDGTLSPISDQVSGEYIFRRAKFTDRNGNVKEYIYDKTNRCRHKREYTGRFSNYPATKPSRQDVRDFVGTPLRNDSSFAASLPNDYSKYYDFDDPQTFYDTIYFWTDFDKRWVYNPNGNMTAYQYEEDLNPLPVNPTSQQYASRHNLREVWTIPTSLAATYLVSGITAIQAEYDKSKANDPTAVVDADKIILEQYTYYPSVSGCCGTNFIKDHTSPEGNVTTYEYDSFGNRTKLIFPKENPSDDDEFVDYTYDSKGRLASIRHPKDGVGHRRFDEFEYYLVTDGIQSDLLKSTTIDSGASFENLVTSYVYDGAGIKTSVTSPRGNESGAFSKEGTTYFEYSEIGWLLKVILPPVDSTSYGSDEVYEKLFEYDKNGNVVKDLYKNLTTDSNGDVVVGNPAWIEYRYTYEELNKLVESSYIDKNSNEVPLSRFEYDHNRNLYRAYQPTALISSSDPGYEPSNFVELVYDERDMLLYSVSNNQNSDPDKLVVRYDYDANGNIKFTKTGVLIDPVSYPMFHDDVTVRTTEFIYDGIDRLVTSIDSMANQVHKTYEKNSNRTATVRSEGQLYDTDNYYEDLFSSLQEFNEFHYEYDSRNRVVKVIDLVFRDTEWTYPYEDFPVNFGEPDGMNEIEYIYAPNSSLSKIIDDHKFEYLDFYDTVGRISQSVDPLGNTVDIVYNANSTIESTTSTEKSQNSISDKVITTNFEYDGLDRLLQIENALNHIGKKHYDSRNNTVLTEDSQNRRKQYLYDEISRITETICNIDPRSGIIPFQNNINSVTDYDVNHRITSISDDKGNLTQYFYDQSDRLDYTQYADGTIVNVLDYTHFNEVYQLVDQNGTTGTNYYDDLGRLIERDFLIPVGSVNNQTTFEQYDYDGASRIKNALNDEYDSGFKYEFGNRLAVQSTEVAFGTKRPFAPFSDFSSSRAIRTELDETGETYAIRYPGNKWTSGKSFLYSQRDELSRIRYNYTGFYDTGNSALESRFMSENFYQGSTSRVVERNQKFFINSTFSFDEINRLTGVVHDQFATNTNPNNDYTISPMSPSRQAYNLSLVWDNLDNKTDRNRAQVEALPVNPGVGSYTPTYYAPENSSYEYDGIDRLYESSTGAQTNTYMLDGAMNRLSATLNGTNYTFSQTVGGTEEDSELNQYTSITPTSSEYGGTLAYDNNGNMVQRTVGTDNRTYVYDVNNRLVQATVDGVTVNLTYDAIGRLILRENVNTSKKIEYFYDGWRLIEERDRDIYEQYTDGSALPSLEAHYMYGSDGPNDVVMMRRKGSSYGNAPSNTAASVGFDSTDFMFIKDDLGNIVAVVDGNGAIHERYEYDDFGVPRILDPDGTTVLTESVIDNPFMYTGARWDEDLGLYYMRNRWYDPTLGRFLTRDPIGIWGDPMNMGNGSAYVGHNPMSYVDPFGLSGCETISNAANNLLDIPYEWHHQVPQFLWHPDSKSIKLRDDFLRAFGLSQADAIAMFNDSKFGSLMPRKMHRLSGGLHPQGYNGAWKHWAENQVEIFSETGKTRPLSKIDGLDGYIGKLKDSKRFGPFFKSPLTMAAPINYSGWNGTKNKAEILRDSMIKSGLLTYSDDAAKKGSKLLGATKKGMKFLPVAAVLLTAHSAHAGYNENGIEGAIYHGTMAKDAVDVSRFAAGLADDALRDSVGNSSYYDGVNQGLNQANSRTQCVMDALQ